MVCGFPPFFSDSPSETCLKVKNFEKNLKFPVDVKISQDCKNLISKLICKQENRLGYKTIDKLKEHPFFKTINWEKVKNQTIIPP